MKKPFKGTLVSLICIAAGIATHASVQFMRPDTFKSNGNENDFPELVGSVVYADNWTEANSPVGLYNIPISSDESFDLKFLGPNANSGGVLVEGKYYVCERMQFGDENYTYFIAYDMNDGEILYERNYPYHTLSMTYDPTTSRIYGIIILEDEYYLTEVNFDDIAGDVELNPIAPMMPEGVGLWNSIACDGNGQLYAIYGNIVVENESYYCSGSTLYKVDKATGECISIGETGYDCTYASDATFDPKTNKLYWTVSPADGSGFLTEVDVNTGAATPIYNFPNNQEVLGLSVVLPLAEPKAPAVATDLATQFTGKSLTGNVIFQTPSTLFDGSAPTGNLDYQIKANGEILASGSANYNERVSAPVTLPDSGYYTFVITTSNSIGSSPKAEVSAYVGADTPEATTVTLKYENGIMNVSWLPVTSSVNGGFIDVDAVRYTVTRFPENVIVAENITECAFAEPIAEPTDIVSYYYEVTAEADGLVSAPARSNYVILGSIEPPFAATFDEGPDGFYTIDANGDGRTWININEHMRVQWNSSMAMDDWLLAPPLRLQGGKYYEIACQLGAQSSNFPERVEIKLGKGPNPDQMTETLLAPTIITNKMSEEPWNWSTSIVPEEDGIYFIGIHGMSDADSYYLIVDNFSITAPRSVAGPAAVDNLKVIPGNDGALTASISFKAPTKTLSGDDLPSLTKIELSRNSEVIKTWYNPGVGSSISYTDHLPQLGDYIYTVVTYNAAGNGGEAVASTFVGVDYPGVITGVHGFETSTPGEVTIVWDAVTSSVKGEPLADGLVRYQVYRTKQGELIPVSGEITGTSFTYQAIPEGEQDFVQYVVVPLTDRGEGESDMTEFFPAGTPYSEYILTKSSDLQHYTCGVSGVGGGSWGTLYDDYFGNVASQDGDNFFFAMVGQFPDCYADFYTGLVKLDMEDPGFTFYTFNLAFDDGSSDTNNIEIYVKEKGASDFTLLKDVIVGETGGSGRWNRVYTDLSAYSGKVVQMCIRPYVRNSGYTFVDNIRIGTVPENDLEIESIIAPAKAMVGKEFPVTVSVVNVGSKTAEGYNVELYADETMIESQPGQTLTPGFNWQAQFYVPMPALASEAILIYAKVSYPADQNEENDFSRPCDVEPGQSNLPGVKDLQGNGSNKMVTLNWEQPEVGSAPGEPITEDFEDADAFSNEYGDWLFIDEDDKEVGGFSDMEVPGIIPDATKGAFWIWDQSQLGNSTFKAHSGSKYLFALYAADDTQTDDWAVSPELDCSAQTISFYAKSYMATYPEYIEVYYSDGSIEPSDFIKIEGAEWQVGGEWTLYEVEVPAGAGRFAIRSCAEGSFMLMVDDVTYIPAGSQTAAVLEGYNVYRNGQRINDALITELTYIDNDVIVGDTYRYVTTAVYNVGESSPSEEIVIKVSETSVDELAANGIRVRCSDGHIIISGAAGKRASISTVDGKLLYDGICPAELNIQVEKGIYIINTDGHSISVFNR